MITFLQPLALLGLLAAGIPPLLHLIERRTPPTVPFPAVHYLAETTREQHRRLKLRNLLLLLLRTGLLALLAIAAARPVVPWALGGAHVPTAVAIVLDNSLSAGAVVDGKPVFDALRDQALGVLRALSGADHVWLTLTDGTPRRLSVDEARASLGAVRVSAERLDVGAAARAAAGVVAADQLPNRVVVVLSDLQATALSPGAVPDVAIVAWSPAASPANHGVDSAWADPPLFRPAGSVMVATSGSTAPVAARLELDGRDVARALARPGELAVFTPPAGKLGWAVGRVRLDPDELKADDDWWLAIHTAAPAGARAGPGAGSFVAEALGVLAAAGRVRAGDAVTIDAELVQRGVSIVVPPADPALVGAVNRTLAARGSAWRFGTLVKGEWEVSGLATGIARVRQRYTLTREGARGGVLAQISGGAREPWMVEDRGLILVASRFEPEWTSLPLEASFVPLLDLMVNRLAVGDVGVVRAAPGQTVTLPDAAASLMVEGRAAAIPADRRFAAPLETGTYFLRDAGGDTVGALLVNHDARESALAPASPAAVRAALGERVMLPTGGVDRAVLQGERRADLSGLLLGLALAVAVFELALASAGGQRS